jgi:hypothetical protein
LRRGSRSGAPLDAASPLGPRLEAITGFVAIVVLLVVLNWFVHKHERGLDRDEL